MNGYADVWIALNLIQESTSHKVMILTSTSFLMSYRDGLQLHQLTTSDVLKGNTSELGQCCPLFSHDVTKKKKKRKEVYFAVSHFDSLHKRAKAATLWYRCKCSNPPGGQNKWRFYKSCESYDSRDTHCLKKGAGYQWLLLIEGSLHG